MSVLHAWHERASSKLKACSLLALMPCTFLSGKGEKALSVVAKGRILARFDALHISRDNAYVRLALATKWAVPVVLKLEVEMSALCLPWCPVKACVPAWKAHVLQTRPTVVIKLLTLPGALYTVVCMDG
eukprot:1158973-Pelagomonas_calceolata.AAC.23